MKERPILFSSPMVRALLDGSKTQTRRIVKSQPPEDESIRSGLYHPTLIDRHGEEYPGDEIFGAYTQDGEWALPCPYGQPGDRLYVRETFFAYGRWEIRYSEKKKRDEWHFVDMTLECDRVYQYAADNPDVPLAKGRGAIPDWWTRPAIFMPRAASRILLDVSAVRVERLNDCSEADAIAEGCTNSLHLPGGRFANENFAHLWWSINGDGAWEANPWVWVVEFKRVTP